MGLCQNGLMHRSELIRRMVLNEISDDYENIDQIILPAVVRESAKHGVTVRRSEIVNALTELVNEGLAKAYFLSSDAPAMEIEGVPRLEAIEKDFQTYFLITPKGMAHHLADDSWWNPDSGIGRTEAI